MNPKIAIIGRPNVGKSTLFNRLIGERKAIESEIPGTTRDLLSGILEVGEREFEILDMAGFIPENTDLDSDVKEKIQEALKSCDLILFVLDFKEGLMERDEQIAEILRKIEKPKIVVVNKADNPKDHESAANFLKLGFKNLIAVSSIHNRNIQALIEEIEKLSPKNTSVKTTEKKPINISIIGRPNVGKSSIFNSVIKKSKAIVRDTPGTTRDTVDSVLNFKDFALRFIDTAGLRRRSKRVEETIEFLSVNRAEQAIAISSIVILVLDAFEGVTHQDLTLLGYVEKHSSGLLILVNKVDLFPPKEKAQKAKKIFAKLANFEWAPIVFVSTKTQENINEITLLINKIIEARDIEISDEDLERFLGKISQEHLVPKSGTKNIKLFKVHQIKKDPLKFMVETNEPSDIHFSFKRYFKNVLRRKFSIYGTEIKIIWKKPK